MLVGVVAVSALAEEARDEVHGVADLHSHLAAHLAIPFMFRGDPEQAPPVHARYRHRTREQMYRDALAASGIVLYVDAAYESPFRIGLKGKEGVAREIDSQLDYVDAFVASDPEHRFAVAHNPSEARDAIREGRIVFVHAIEGANKLVSSREDAEYWAGRGVALVTPIHLADSPLGGATHTDTFLQVTNFRGAVGEVLHPRRERGLTALGEAVVRDLAGAGILIDLQHMHPDAVDDTLGILESLHLPPIVSHGDTFAVRGEPHAMSDERIQRIYALGGIIAIAGNSQAKGPYPKREFWASHEPLPDYCPRSLDDLALHAKHLVDLTGSEPFGWGSDFNGGVDHFRPKYGPHGCRGARSDGTPLDAYDTHGLVHAGAVPDFLRHLEADDGVDLAPIEASAERFIEMWERAWMHAHPSPAEDGPR